MFGSLSGIAALFWLHALLAREQQLLPCLGGLLLSVACLLLAHSAQRHRPDGGRHRRWLHAAAALAVPPAAPQTVPGRHARHRRAGLHGRGLAAGAAVSDTGDPGDALYVNRGEIWQIITAHVLEHPLAGTGYGAYWTGPLPESPSYTFLRVLYFYPGEAHNGYLDLANDLGLVGLALLIAYCAVFVRQSLGLMKTGRLQAALFLALCLQQALMNLSESTWLEASAPSFFMIMTTATLALARMAMEPALAAAPQ